MVFCRDSGSNLIGVATNKDKIRAAAQKYLQKGQIDKAIREFERLVEDDPNDVRTLLKIGDLQTRKGDQAAATVTYGNVAKYYSDQGFFLKAVAVYKQILKLDPALVDVNLRLAELYHQLGLMSDAIAQYRTICEIYEKAERWDDCQNVLTKMLELEPNNLAARIKLAETHARAGRTEQAKTDFGRAAQQLKSENRIEDYIKVAERLVHVDPNDMATMRELASIYIEKNDARRALAKLQVCFRANPKEVETLNLLSRAFEDLGQTQKAVSVLKELAEVHGSSGNQAARQTALRKIAILDPATAAEATALGHSQAAAASPAQRDSNSTVTGVLRPPPKPPAQPVPAPAPVREAVRDEALISDIAEMPTDADDDSLVAEPLSEEEEATLSGPEDLNKLLVEADIYIKYGLRNKAIDHLERVLSLQPHHRDAQERYKNVLLDADDTEGASARLLDMAQTALAEGQNDLARGDLEELLSLEPAHSEARALMRKLSGEATPTPTPAVAPQAEVAKAAHAAEVEVPLEMDMDLLVETEAPASRSPGLPIDDTVGAELSIEVETDAFGDIDAAAMGLEGEDEIAVELETDVLLPAEPAHSPAPTTPASRAAEVTLPAPVAPTAPRQPGVQLQAAPPSDAPRPRGEAAAAPRGGVAKDPLEGLGPTRPAESVAEAARPAAKPAGRMAEPARTPEAAKPAERASISALDLDDLVQNAVPTRAAAKPVARADLPAKIPSYALPPTEPEPERKLAPNTPAVAPPAAAAEDELDLRAELDEVEFFLQQGLTEEAEEALNALVTFYADHSGVLALQARMQGSNAPAPASEEEPEPETVHIARVEADLQEELEQVANPNGDDDFGMSFEDVFNQFKKGVAQQVDQEDYDTHYNLGIAYKEMGLLEDAIREFELTARAPQLEINALMMMGLCMLERGSTDDALRCFMQGLSWPSRERSCCR